MTRRMQELGRGRAVQEGGGGGGCRFVTHNGVGGGEGRRRRWHGGIGLLGLGRARSRATGANWPECFGQRHWKDSERAYVHRVRAHKALTKERHFERRFQKRTGFS